MNLSELFGFLSRTGAELSGWSFKDQTYTFGDLDSRSNRVAHWLQSNGFIAGDRLCVYLPNCVEMIDI